MYESAENRLFGNRREAGRILAEQLQPYAGRPDAIVFGLTRGGVPVAFEVAKALGLALEPLVVRKLGSPWNPELAMGAIAPDGVRVLNEGVVTISGISEAQISAAEMRERLELERRERLYRRSAPAPELRGKLAILVDDGLATGATMRAAVEWAKRHGAAEIVVAAPVAAAETCRHFTSEKEGVLCICSIRPEDFAAVGMWYEDFSQTSDDEVVELLDGLRRDDGSEDSER